MADETKDLAQGEEKKSKMIIYVIVGVIALLLIIAGVIIAIMLSSNAPSEDMQATPAQTQMQNAQATPQSSARGSASYLTVGQMYPLDQFIVNLTTQSGRRYLKTTMNLEISQANLAAELDTKRAVIRDTVIAILSSKSIEEISTIKGKEKLKSELIDRFNEFLVDGKVVNLFFTDFVVQ